MTSSRTPADVSRADHSREGERIAKLLARAGIASRREVERMIAEGRVRIGDEVVTTPNTVLRNLNGVSVDGQPVRAAEAPRLFVFHKPSGLITAERDPAGRPTIYTALRNALPPGTPRLMPIGRLDLNTEGLLLLTNDGELKRAMELPSSGIPRTYRARTFGDITQAQLEQLIEGVTIDGIRYGRIDANMERRTGRNQWIEMTITEGKNREVRRVLENLGLQVSRLMRISYGPFVLGDLPRGMAGEVRQADVERFRRGMNLPGTIAVMPRARPAPAKPLVRERPAGPSRPERPSARDRTERPARPEARAYNSPGKSSAKPRRPEVAERQDRPERARRPDDRRRPDAPARSEAPARAPAPRKPARHADSGREILTRSELGSADNRRSSSQDASRPARPARPARGKGWARPAAPRRPGPRK